MPPMPAPSSTRQRSRQGRHPWWQGWALALSLFSFIVVLTRPPPTDETVATTAIRAGDNSLELEDEYDVLVQCELATPFSSEQPLAEGILDITVYRTLAPQASKAFLGMVEGGHFDGCFFFRCIDNFIVQVGITPTAKKKEHFAKAPIDTPPTDADRRRSNVRGALNFAGGNSATGQIYINRGNSVRLDKEPGSLPFASLDDQSMKIIDAIFSYKEGLGEVKAVKAGDQEVRSKFPRMSRIEHCWIESEHVPASRR